MLEKERQIRAIWRYRSRGILPVSATAGA